jgi:membrane protein DedA with SNARE-associated domain
VSIHHLLGTYGYSAVLVLVTAECLGLPLPGETILIAAAAYAGTTHRLSIWAIAGVALAGAVIGDNIGFWIGAKGGYRLLRRYGRYVRLDDTKVKIGRYIFDRQGPKVVFFGRFVSVLRTYAAFLAGTLRMRWRVFLPYNASGGILWAAVYSFVPYEAGSTIATASRVADYVLGAGAVIGIVGGFLLVRRTAAQLAERAEAAYPGPLPDR